MVFDTYIFCAAGNWNPTNFPNQVQTDGKAREAWDSLERLFGADPGLDLIY